MRRLVQGMLAASLLLIGMFLGFHVRIPNDVMIFKVSFLNCVQDTQWVKIFWLCFYI